MCVQLDDDCAKGLTRELDDLSGMIAGRRSVGDIMFFCERLKETRNSLNDLIAKLSPPEPEEEPEESETENSDVIDLAARRSAMG
ncbi:hypothetical protein C4568_04920 [Candidatus Parcubacteria bacterium]|nr:MAG: hypothetical protein C4568_04920 [Candidatus Parcubacteria bacterium]